MQFLTEAVVLTGLGGASGMLLGWLISLLRALRFPNLPTAVPLWAAVRVCGLRSASGCSSVSGRHKAARLDPVEALRYE